MNTMLSLTEAHTRPAELRAEATHERLAAQVMGPAPWWRRLLGLPGPKGPARRGNRTDNEAAPVARCGA